MEGLRFLYGALLSLGKQQRASVMASLDDSVKSDLSALIPGVDILVAERVPPSKNPMLARDPVTRFLMASVADIQALLIRENRATVQYVLGIKERLQRYAGAGAPDSEQGTDGDWRRADLVIAQLVGQKLMSHGNSRESLFRFGAILGRILNRNSIAP